MNAKNIAHTPGPWTYHDETGSIRSTLASKRCVAQTNWMLRKHHWAEHEANVRLIAAAPELLEALEVVAARFTAGNGYYDNCGIGDSGFTWGQVRAAIRKAKGEL